MKKVCKIFLVAAILLLCIALLPTQAQAATAGTCGENLIWTLDNAGTLTISGSGKMYDYASYSKAPWYSEKESIKTIVIEDGVTTIGRDAFYYCYRATSVTIGDSVTTVSTLAFRYCYSLKSVTFGNSVNFVGGSAFMSCDDLTEIILPRRYIWFEAGAFHKPLKTVYYMGTEEDWINLNYALFKSATIIYNFTGCKHVWNEGSVTKPATCKETGSKTVTCTVCNATQAMEIPTLTTHTYGICEKVNDTTHKYTCTVCGKIEIAFHNWNENITKYSNCIEEGLKDAICTDCSTTKTEVIAKSTIHTYTNDCDTDCNVCGATRTITHKYKTSWSKDKTGHWHECSVCKDKKDFAEHKPGAAATEESAQTCTACKYVIAPQLAHTHKFSTEWTTDENSHWQICSGCEEKGSFEAHIFDNACDTDCNTCGFVRTIEHIYKTEWSKDANGHWHECSICGAKADEIAHIPGAEATETTAQTCTECGYELAPIVVKPAEDGGSTTIIIVACVVGVAAIGGGAALFFIKKKS